jgi:NADH dehydrogenase [ubiquinone] 1 alpha subcomplex assembly factor 5
MTSGLDPRDMSNLMSRAGFTLLTVDVDEVRVGYPSMWELLDDLRDMGENNAIIGRYALRI